ncbi:MAG TPA: 4-(cytidine 5'-diphospho)-2-C-methyl-D-erythritol kinase [Gammaproteobacteria bacterium]|nr:4-(cytidine 5'-diphospho)-2-C-methyl-D-erythritol kinase [Gammaproteobacteria bacterium]
MSARVIVTAPAKVNLYLHVTGRRPDGYHLLDSLVVFAGLADRVTLEAADDFSLSLAGPFAAGLDAGEGNLALRAARALVAECGGAVGPAALSIEKNIPLAAGLGGGSADAAAVMAGLAALSGTGMDAARRIAPGLGADVPACLRGRSGFVAGIGEEMGPEIPIPGCGLLLVNPGVSLDTRAVFDAFDAADEGHPPRDSGPRPPLPSAGLSAEALAGALAGTANDLTAAAVGLRPEIGAVVDAVEELEGCRFARMTGSGATCFGLFDNPESAAARAETLAAGEPHWWCWGGGFAPGMTIL